MHPVEWFQEGFYCWVSCSFKKVTWWFAAVLVGGWMGGSVCVGIRSSLHSVRFWQLLRCAHKRIVNIMKVYIERNNIQVELIEFRKYWLYSRFRGEDFREPLYVYSLFARWQQLATNKLIRIHSPDGSTPRPVTELRSSLRLPSTFLTNGTVTVLNIYVWPTISLKHKWLPRSTNNR